MKMPFKEISINDFKYLRNYEPLLKVFLDGIELSHFYESTWKAKRRLGQELEEYEKEINNNRVDTLPKECFNYFVIAKFFLFIALSPKLGLKILVNGVYNDKLKKIIQIQKLLFKEGFAFDCEENVLEIELKQDGTAEKRVHYGYITDTDIHHNCLGEFNVEETAASIISIFRANKIDRRNLVLEMLKNYNYILTCDGQPKLIDIDPYFYYVE